MALPPNLITDVTAKLPGDYKPPKTWTTDSVGAMPRTIVLDMPYPPSVNHYWRHARGRTYISAEGKRFRKNVVLRCTGIATMFGRLEVRIVIHPPDRLRRDIDNVLKALLDALQHAGVYKNDNQIDVLTISRCQFARGYAAAARVEIIQRSEV